MSTPTVHIRNISKSYGAVPVFNGLSFCLQAGEALAILGPSGCGKTTLLRLIAGLDVPNEGEILLSGQLASNQHIVMPPYQRNIGFVFQQPTLWPYMTVRQQLEFVSRQRQNSTEQRKRLYDIMDNTGISEFAQRYPCQLSGGQARRVAIARAFAAHPRLLLLDEPLINLDSSGKQDLLTVIANLRKEIGCAMLYVTHDRDEVMALTDRDFTIEQIL